MRAGKIASQYVEASSINLSALSLFFVAFDRPSDFLHVYRHFDYCLKDTTFELM